MNKALRFYHTSLHEINQKYKPRNVETMEVNELNVHSALSIPTIEAKMRRDIKESTVIDPKIANFQIDDFDEINGNITCECVV
jgi:hypothetical protein